MDIVIILLRVALFLLCLFMGLVILMQRSKQEGLGAAFGSSMTESVFGAETTNVLVKATVWSTVLFFVLVLTLSSILSHRHQPGGSLNRLLPQVTSTNFAPTATNVVDAVTNSVEAALPATNAPTPAANR
jgi:preprotein translocase subunit SecG